MRINFRQGIIKYPSSGSTQNFLSYSGGYVSLIGSNGNIDVTASHATENYLITESATVPNAWGPLPTGTMCWLYWDINLRTAVRTFGYTTVQPITSSSRPALVEDQHWFNTVDTTMYVCSGGTYRAVCRVFAASVIDGLFAPVSDAMQSKPFSGTQVGINVAGTRVGNIIIDADGDPVRRVDGRFFTTEDEFFVNGAPINAVKLDAAIVPATADTMLPKYYVVKFTDFGRINLATYEDVQTSTIALLTEDLTTHQTGYVIVQGCVTNPEWNWDTLSNLWVVGNGELTTRDPYLYDPVNHPIKKPPVGRVISSDTIIFDQGLGGIGADGPPGAGTNLATSYSYGVSRLSLEAVDVGDPIVAGDNDPRLSDARVPLAHSQAASTIIPSPYGSLTGANLQLTLMQIEDGKVNVAGDTMTGSLILNADPTVDLEAATKHYVDIHTQDLSGLVAKAGDTMTGSLILNADPTVDLEAATKHYVDNAIPTIDEIIAVFQVGTVVGPDHVHYAYLHQTDAEALILGTVGSVVITPVEVNAHTHDLTIAYDNVQAVFYVTNIANNTLDNHIAFLVDAPIPYRIIDSTTSLAVNNQTESLTFLSNGVQKMYVDSSGMYLKGPDLTGAAWFGYVNDWYDVREGYVSGIAFNSTGNIIAVGGEGNNGYVTITELDQQGNIVMMKDIINDAGNSWSAGEAVAVDSQDNIIVLIYDDNTGTYFATKVSPLGVVLWSNQLPTDTASYSYDVRIGPSDSVIVGGKYSEFSSFVASMDASTGTVDWITELTPTRVDLNTIDFGGVDIPDFTVDSTGNTYVLLDVMLGNDLFGNEYQSIVMKLDNTGTIVWQQRYEAVGYEINVGRGYYDGIVYDEVDDALYVGINQKYQDIYVQNQPHILKIWGVDGSRSWSQKIIGSYNVGSARLTTCVLDPVSHIVYWSFASVTTNGSDNTDYMIVATDSDGNVAWANAIGLTTADDKYQWVGNGVNATAYHSGWITIGGYGYTNTQLNNGQPIVSLIPSDGTVYEFGGNVSMRPVYNEVIFASGDYTVYTGAMTESSTTPGVNLALPLTVEDVINVSMTTYLPIDIQSTHVDKLNAQMVDLVRDPLYPTEATTKKYVDNLAIITAGDWGSEDMSNSPLDAGQNGYYYVSFTDQFPVIGRIMGASPSGTLTELTLEIVSMPLGFAPTWPDNIRWPSSTVPDLTTAVNAIVEFYTRDGGETWFGFLVAVDMTPLAGGGGS